MPTFKVQGQVYHLVGSLLPEKGKPFFNFYRYIYFISEYNELANVRLSNFQNLNKRLIMELQDCLHQVNLLCLRFESSFRVNSNK